MLQPNALHLFRLCYYEKGLNCLVCSYYECLLQSNAAHLHLQFYYHDGSIREVWHRYIFCHLLQAAAESVYNPMAQDCYWSNLGLLRCDY